MRNGQELDREQLQRIRLVVFDFDGVFTDNCVYVLQDGTEAVRCWRGDGIGLANLARVGVESVIVSTESNPVVTARSRKLGIRCIQACSDKREAVAGLLKEMQLSSDQVAFVGNDTNDLSCLSFVGLPIVVADAHPSTTLLAQFQTTARGGQGAVREVCDLFTDALAKKEALA